MPGPGNRAKRANRIKSPSIALSGAVSLRDAYLDDLDLADGWTPIVNILCSVFELPDLTTRKGLKKIHANFDTIYRRLDDAYQRNLNNLRMRGGIVGIYAKLSVDSLLRNKLFERGFLDKLMPLLEEDYTRSVALRALTNVTQHGGTEVRSKIAERADSLTRLVDAYPHDEVVCDLTISILAHTITVITDGVEGSPAFPEILKKLDMQKILRTAMFCMTQPFTCRSCVEHGTQLLASTTLHASEAHKAVRETEMFMIAGLRSEDWAIRCLSLGGLMRLYKPGSEEDTRFLDPQKLLSIARSIPPTLQDAMMAYGPPGCDVFLTLSATRDFTRAIMGVAQDRDLYALGMTMYKIILSAEFSISDGYYETINEQTGAREMLDIGLPFKRYSDALPVCAKVIREKGDRNELDAANVLEIKFNIMRQKVAEAAELARRGLERNPHFAYYYYAISLSADHTNGLRSSKKGLMCKEITPFVKFQLMQRAVEHAGELGLETLQSQPEPGHHKWEEGIAFLTSALEDANSFIEQAPPDNRYLKNVSSWYILLTILISETISPDLREIKLGLERLRLADEFSTLIDMKPPQTMLRLTQQAVVRLFKKSIEKYGGMFERVAHGTKQPGVEPKQLQDDLSVWLENDHIDDIDGHEKEPTYYIHPKINTSNVALYRCSHCGNPSAALRKCSGCAKTRYCDVTCQKAHWSEHKRSCKV